MIGEKQQQLLIIARAAAALLILPAPVAVTNYWNKFKILPIRNKTMEDLYKVDKIEGKGFGWIALQDIKAGTLICKEKSPFVTIFPNARVPWESAPPDFLFLFYVNFDGCFLCHE